MKITASSEFEIKYLRKERKLIKSLCNNFNSWALLLSIIFLSLYFISNKVLFNGYNYLLLNGFKNFYVFTFSLVALAGLAYVSIYVSQKYRLIYQVFSSAITWILMATFVFQNISTFLKNIEVALFIPALFITGALYWIASKNEQRKLASFIIFSIFFWASYFYVFFMKTQFDNSVLGYFWELKIPFLWIFISIVPFQFPKEEKINWFYLFNPAHISRGVIWPSSTEYSTDYSEKKALWIHGMLNLILALILMNARMLLESNYLSLNTTIFGKSAFTQLLRILTDVGICNIITGMARLFGYKVPDATSFVLLAKTPAEFWRRGSVYTYQFILRTIFLPIFNLTKNRYFAVFIAFLFFYLNRVGFDQIIGNFGFLGGNFSGYYLESALKINSLIFIFYYLSIIISQKYWFVSKENLNKPGFSWLSILLTHLSNISIITLARYLVRYL